MTAARRPRGTTVFVAIAFVAIAAFAAPALAARSTGTTADEPSITIGDQTFTEEQVNSGATFEVAGKGWPADTLVQLEICGAEGRSGSSDCAAEAAQVVASNARGNLSGRLSLVVPPSPCPCVVRAISDASSAIATTPIDIPSAPSALPGDGTVTAPAMRRLDVSNTALQGGDSFGTWLGRAPQRTFVFDVKNTGSVAVTNATITLSAGPADNPTGFVTPIRIERMEVGETRRFSVPITFQNLAYGRQAVRATVNGTSVPIAFTASTTTHPWLLIIVPILLVLQAILLGIRNLVRRRLHESDEAAAPETEPAGPADDALICVVESTLTDPSGNVPAEHRTQVVRSIAEVQLIVLDSLSLDQTGRAMVPDGLELGISTITVLADADARVGAAHHACDVLCSWVEDTYATSTHPAARSFALRRHQSGASAGPEAGAGMGMVSLATLVRVPHIRAVA